jgi:hypothetical protein
LRFKASNFFDPVYVVAILPILKDTANIEESAGYLSKMGIEYINGYSQITDEFLNVNKSLKPDIVFFRSHYDMNNYFFSIDSFPPVKVLSFYICYGYFLADQMSHHFNQKLLNFVYKIFPTAPVEIELLKKHSPIKGINVCQTFLGYPKIEKLLSHNYKAIDIWKKKNNSLKRIIWAPHHYMGKYSNFLEYKDYFFQLLKKYENQIQIVFKPHPLLYKTLITNAKWTKQEVDSYYSKWESMPNTQLETGNWIDLFLTSDAMILDSISFMVEFSVTGKPACVLTRLNNGERKMKFNEVGEELFEKLYHASNVSEVEKFINDIVLNENDYKKEERDVYIKKNFIGENNMDATQNIFDYIKAEIEQG